jgi:dihydrofolate synthase/folylpolyglutamate synthase
MNYKESLEYIDSLAVFGSRPGMERIEALVHALGDPQKKMHFIHVAGTNGKGSVCTALSCILSDSGYKTGLFTSPFVVDFRERFRINGEYISEEDFARICTRIRPIAEKNAESGLQPTEFEVLTAAAFEYFLEKKCDVVVLETGLGGLLDSTNIIDTPDVSVITSVSFDHMKVLGSTIEQIAQQKAGIIKKNGRTVTGADQDKKAMNVIREKAAGVNSELYISDPGEITVLSKSIKGTEIDSVYGHMTLHLLGDHQISNLAVSLAAVKAARDAGYDIPDSAVVSGVSRACVPARFEILSEAPLVILDGGHNADGARVLSQTLKELAGEKHTIVIIGMMADKEYDKALSYIAPLADTVITTTPSNPRALSAKELAEHASVYCKDTIAIDEPVVAYAHAKSCAAPSDCILICGSLYLASDIRPACLDIQ